MMPVRDCLDTILNGKRKSLCKLSKNDLTDFLKDSNCNLTLSARAIEIGIEKGEIVMDENGLIDAGEVLEFKFSKGISESKLKFHEESAKKLELQNAETEGRLISRRFAESVFFKLGNLTKSLLMPLSKRIISAIKGETDSFIIETKIDNAVREALCNIEDNRKEMDFGDNLEEQENGQNN